ncbi:NAD-dependent epimerase/dehydratase family protein [Henriciella sp. AS95]|uniref:NAD-dependent epimerase/dehydratase family protein n=1 Tax=Henriciella sp. AS95 TaxID=3135782 RepID=UPI00317C8AB4
MAKVFITGGDSFTGTHLRGALHQQGYETFCSTNSGTTGSEWYDCDITDRSQITRVVADVQPDYIIHLAGISFAAHPNPAEIYNANLFGTENLLHAAANASPGVRKILLASSANVYGVTETEVQDEALCPAPVNHYAGSKLAMEHMAATWFERLPIILTRPFNYTGRGQTETFLIPKIVAHFARRAPTIELGNIDVSRDFSDVRDVCASYIGLMESGASSTVANICSGQLTSLQDIIEHCRDLAGHTIDVTVNPDFVRKNEIKKLCGSNARLQALAGPLEFRPIRETLDWMLSSQRT